MITTTQTTYKVTLAEFEDILRKSGFLGADENIVSLVKYEDETQDTVVEIKTHEVDTS
jgi:hypothetical protein